MKLARRRWGPDRGLRALLLHGANGSSTSWTRLAAWLTARGWSTVAMDLRGHGVSPRFTGGEDPATLANDVLDTARSEALEPFDLLVGHSLGSLVALAAMRRDASFARRVVLVDPPGRRSVDYADLARETVARHRRASRSPDSVLAELRARLPWLSEEERIGVRDSTIDVDAAGLGRLVRALPGVSIAEDATQVSAPVLLVLGREPDASTRGRLAGTAQLDRQSSLVGEDRQELIGCLADVHVVAIDAGHAVHLERFDTFVEALETWLQTRSARRVAVITGAGQGLGRAEALELAGRGVAVVLNDLHSVESTRRAVEAQGGTAAEAIADVGTYDGGRRLLSSALDAFGDVHILVNNAGAVRDGMCFSLDEDAWEMVVRTNLTGQFAPLRHMAEYWREQAKRGVHDDRAVVCTTSESGLYGNVGQANYAAAKAGAAMLALVAATELRRYGVRVNAVAPRARTRMSQSAFGPLTPAQDGLDRFHPDHVARFVGWLTSPDAAPITGQVFVAFGGHVALIQGWRPAATFVRPHALTDGDFAQISRELFAATEPIAAAADVRRLFDPPH